MNRYVVLFLTSISPFSCTYSNLFTRKMNPQLSTQMHNFAFNLQRMLNLAGNIDTCLHSTYKNHESGNGHFIIERSEHLSRYDFLVYSQIYWGLFGCSSRLCLPCVCVRAQAKWINSRKVHHFILLKYSEISSYSIALSHWYHPSFDFHRVVTVHVESICL